MNTKMLLSAVESAVALGISERAFHALRGREGFPQPIVLGARIVRWRSSDIEAWIADLAAEKRRAEPQQLATPEARAKRDAKVRARRDEKFAAQRATEQVAA